mmetsp:Transcript_9142/g.17103  ORF Transcript_9142/g.17103 Transcript_9142/m.17103 type:complete len:274 (+) Transcript_9142:169-990(+)
MSFTISQLALVQHHDRKSRLNRTTAVKTSRKHSSAALLQVRCHGLSSKSETSEHVEFHLPRRVTLKGAAVTALAVLCHDPPSALSEMVDMPSLRGTGIGKSVTIYPDYVLKDNGLQYKDLRVGQGQLLQKGDKVLVDWDAFTIGYYGRIVQAKNLTKGGDYEGSENQGFLRFTMGADEMIPGFQDAMEGMQIGGIRRVVVPPGPLNYPTDTGFKKIGPVPTAFGGKRTLDFVTRNEGAIDKTLLFDIELLGIGDGARAKRQPGTWVVDMNNTK